MDNVLIPLVLAWLLVGEPLWGRASHKRLLERLGKGENDARRRFYRHWITGLWTLALVALLVVLVTPGLNLTSVGLRWPSFNTGSGVLSNSFVKGAIIGLLIGALVVAALAVLAAWRAGQASQVAPVGPQPPARVLAMLPRTPAERHGFAGLSITAGIAEEFVWRGFLMAAMPLFLPGLPLFAVIILSAAIFGWGHLYQGLAGIVVTAALGGLFALLYVATNSLLLPVVLHALIDLRALLVPVATTESDQPAARSTGSGASARMD